MLVSSSSFKLIGTFRLPCKGGGGGGERETKFFFIFFIFFIWGGGGGRGRKTLELPYFSQVSLLSQVSL